MEYEDYEISYDIEWERDGDTLIVTLVYDGEEYPQEYTIVDISDDEMELEDEYGDTFTCTRQ